MRFSQSEHDGGHLAALCGVGNRQGLVDAFGADFVFGNGEIRPGFQSQLAELGPIACFHQLVAVGGGAGVEPEPGKPGEQKHASRHQENPQ